MMCPGVDSVSFSVPLPLPGIKKTLLPFKHFSRAKVLFLCLQREEALIKRKKCPRSTISDVGHRALSYRSSHPHLPPEFTQFPFESFSPLLKSWGYLLRRLVLKYKPSERHLTRLSHLCPTLAKRFGSLQLDGNKSSFSNKAPWRGGE